MITKQLAIATTVAAALWTIGCGKTREVRDSAPSAMGGAHSMAGAMSASGTGGAAASSGSLGVGGQAGGVLTWDALECHVSPVPEPSDPTAREQWSLARKYCTTLGQQNCFSGGAVLGGAGCTVDELVEACVAQLLWYHHQSVPPECEGVWRDDLECGAKSTFVAPCSEVGVSSVYGASASCAQENAAFQECIDRRADTEVTGSYTSCHYSSSSSGCAVACQVGANSVVLDCSGPDGLPKQCGCAINGHASPNSQPIFVSDCADAAAQAADGLCTGQLDCCFEYLDRNKQACRCSVPAEYGYDSCEQMMAFAQGQRVDICPGLMPDPGNGCWPPGACPPYP